MGSNAWNIPQNPQSHISRIRDLKKDLPAGFSSNLAFRGNGRLSFICNENTET